MPLSNPIKPAEETYIDFPSTPAKEGDIVFEKTSSGAIIRQWVRVNNKWRRPVVFTGGNQLDVQGINPRAYHFPLRKNVIHHLYQMIQYYDLVLTANGSRWDTTLGLTERSGITRSLLFSSSVLYNNAIAFQEIATPLDVYITPTDASQNTYLAYRWFRTGGDTAATRNMVEIYLNEILD